MTDLSLMGAENRHIPSDAALHIEAAIFDMDGLMFDTERLHQAAWHKIETEIGLPFHSDMPDMTGMNAASIDRMYRERYGDSFDYSALRARCQAYCTEYLDRYGVPIKPGLIALLEALKDRKITCALATSTYRASAMTLLQRAGVEDYFQFKVFGDQVRRSKPDPEIFFLAAKGLHARPERTLVLEDSINGATAGCDGGFLTVMIPDLRQPDTALESRLTGKLTSLLEVIPLVERAK